MIVLIYFDLTSRLSVSFHTALFKCSSSACRRFPTNVGDFVHREILPHEEKSFGMSQNEESELLFVFLVQAHFLVSDPDVSWFPDTASSCDHISRELADSYPSWRFAHGEKVWEHCSK